SRKAHAKSSSRPEVPRKLLAREDNKQIRDIVSSQSQILGGTIELKRKEASKFTGTKSTQKSRKGSLLMSKDCGIVKDLSVISSFDYECNDAYFDFALKFLHTASLLETYYNDFSKLKGMVDPLSVYSTAAKLS
nr:cullin, conserved site-containing protein [Tanacetum cinerariifolium]